MNLKQFKKKLRKDPKYVKAELKIDFGFAISLAITELRIRKGLTQVKLAKFIGTKQESIARAESGYMPSTRFLQKIANACDVILEINFKDRLPDSYKLIF